MNNAQCFANWVEIEMSTTLLKPYKFMTIYIFKILYIYFPIFKLVQNLVLDWKIILFKDLIFRFNQLHVKHKSHVFQPTITPMSWKPWNYFMHVIFLNAWFTLEMHLHFTFSSNNYNVILNNTLFVFWNMNLKF
jgi:hypothetical protein